VLKNAVNAQLHALRSRKRAQFDALLHEMSVKLLPSTACKTALAYDPGEPERALRGGRLGKLRMDHES